ncbi:hypothetical protein KSS87_006605 [Heliosperma pusillum]|nr:hypothetical protein KSS87_006605 [Heliosperma pusillum]
MYIRRFILVYIIFLLMVSRSLQLLHNFMVMLLLYILILSMCMFNRAFSDYIM